MSNEEIRFTVGALLQLELLGMHLKVREPARVVGYLQPTSLLITTPRDKGALIPVRDGDDIAVRYMDGEHVAGFKTSVMRICRDPFPYLHLYYPIAVEKVRVRNAERVATEMSVKVKGTVSADASMLDAIMKDLSISGARLFSTAELGVIGARLTIETNITFAGLTESLTFFAIIRNVSEPSEMKMGEMKTGKLYQYGVEFIELSPQAIVFMQGYIFECMINSRKR